jgi:hypothetical protein
MNAPTTFRGYDRRIADTANADHLGERVCRCVGCDTPRPYQFLFCKSCNEVTDSYIGREFGTLERYWRDPVYRAECEEERKAGQNAIDALFSPHDARDRARQEARWAREEGEGL